MNRGDALDLKPYRFKEYVDALLGIQRNFYPFFCFLFDNRRRKKAGQVGEDDPQRRPTFSDRDAECGILLSLFYMEYLERVAKFPTGTPYKADPTTLRQLWFCMTRSQIAFRTGLSASRQARCEKWMIELGFIKRRGGPKTGCYYYFCESPVRKALWRVAPTIIKANAEDENSVPLIPNDSPLSVDYRHWRRQITDIADTRFPALPSVDYRQSGGQITDNARSCIVVGISLDNKSDSNTTEQQVPANIVDEAPEADESVAAAVVQLNLGISLPNAHQLVGDYGRQNVRLQINCWRYRPQSKASYCKEKGISQAGAFITSVKDGWAVPPEYDSARTMRRRANQQKAQDDANAAAAAEEKARIAAYRSSLSPEGLRILRLDAIEEIRKLSTWRQSLEAGEAHHRDQNLEGPVRYTHAVECAITDAENELIKQDMAGQAQLIAAGEEQEAGVSND